MHGTSLMQAYLSNMASGNVRLVIHKRGKIEMRQSPEKRA